MTPSGDNCLYVSDLDGTLLHDNQLLSRTTVRILNRLIADGIMFTVATARSLHSAWPLLRDLDLKLPLVLMNGIFVVDPQTGEALQSNFLSTEVAGEILDHHLRDGLHPFVHTVDDQGSQHVYYSGIVNDSEDYYVSGRLKRGDDRFRLIKNYDQVTEEAVLAINAIDHESQLRTAYEWSTALESTSVHFGPDIYTPGFHWLEVSDRRASKGAAVTFVREHVKAAQLVTFGDAHNDLSMFAVSDESYAVANADPTVQEAVTAVIASNLDDGVAHHLTQLVRSGRTGSDQPSQRL